MKKIECQKKIATLAILDDSLVVYFPQKEAERFEIENDFKLTKFVTPGTVRSALPTIDGNMLIVYRVEREKASDLDCMVCDLINAESLEVQTEKRMISIDSTVPFRGMRPAIFRQLDDRRLLFGSRIFDLKTSKEVLNFGDRWLPLLSLRPSLLNHQESDRPRIKENGQQLFLRSKSDRVPADLEIQVASSSDLANKRSARIYFRNLSERRDTRDYSLNIATNVPAAKFNGRLKNQKPIVESGGSLFCRVENRIYRIEVDEEKLPYRPFRFSLPDKGEKPMVFETDRPAEFSLAVEGNVGVVSFQTAGSDPFVSVENNDVIVDAPAILEQFIRDSKGYQINESSFGYTSHDLDRNRVVLFDNHERFMQVTGTRPPEDKYQFLYPIYIDATDVRGNVARFHALIVLLAPKKRVADLLENGKAPEYGVPAETEWGSIISVYEATQLTIDKPISSLPLPDFIPNVTRATSGGFGWADRPLAFSSNDNATEVTLHLLDQPGQTEGANQRMATIETGTKSGLKMSGRILFAARDASIDTLNRKGKVTAAIIAKKVSQSGNHHIGNWTELNERLSWNFGMSRPGKYKVFLTWSSATEADTKASDISISIHDGSSAETLSHTVTGTGDVNRFQSVEVGEVYFSQASRRYLILSCSEVYGDSVMNFKALTFVPACEGQPPIQEDDGDLFLNAKDATVCGRLLQWEPSPKKRTLGYWAETSDFAYWDFEVTQAGTFDVAILQGCGKDQGGSEVTFTFYKWGDSKQLAILPHTVIDTGHWQEFKKCELGTTTLEAGKYRLRVLATSKATDAVMDLQQVELTLVDK